MSKRSGHGLGPFSGAQITTMVCVVIAAVAFPVGAWAAVSGSNVFVTDATSGATAKVNKTGAVSVSGSVMSNLQGSASGNKADVTTDQQLLTAEASPNAFYSSSPGAILSGVGPLLSLVPGHAIIVKSIRVSTLSSSGADPYVRLYESGASTCDGSLSRDLGYVDVASGVNATIIWPFDPGLPVPDGIQLCAAVLHTSADITVNGYLVPATAVNAPIRTLTLPRTRA